MKILWLDLETTSLDEDVANVLDVAVALEVDRVPLGGLQSFLVQPLLHEEDQLYGQVEGQLFIDQHNQRCGSRTECRLTPFRFADEDPPLFFYSAGVLTLGMPSGQIKDPAEWLTDERRVRPVDALMGLVDLLDRNNQVSGRWTVAGHNPGYDFRVLTAWGRRVLGADAFEELLGSRINSYYGLDTVALARWFGYKGSLRTERNKYTLGHVAKALGIPLVDAHTAEADLGVTIKIAKRLLGEDC